VAAVLTTASPISSELEQEVQSVLAAATGKTIRLETCVDPALIGGMVVQVGSKVYDASVRSQLESMRQSLLAGGAIATSVEA
jgi:F-type H+-transporting ATPase subunit delta